MQQKTQEGSDSSSDYGDEVEEFQFKMNWDQPVAAGITQVFVATYGIQSVWLQSILELNGAKRIGYLNFSKSTQSGLASVYQSSTVLAFLFNRELKDYHYTDYNFGRFLMTVVPKTASFVVITDVNVNLLATKIQVDQIEFRQLSTGKGLQNIKRLESPNEMQGLFADVYSHLVVTQVPVVGVLVILEEYEATHVQLERLRLLGSELGFPTVNLPKKTDELRKLNQTKYKDILYL